MSPGRRRATRSPENAPRGVRLQKILAAAGVASRRAAEDLIRSGRVTLNGRTVTRPGTLANPLRDQIRLDGRRVGRPRPARHYLLNKPRGVVTTARDPHARRTVLDLVPSRERLFPVGRLDAASEGLLLLTNDGSLAQVLLHPSFQVPRTYRVSVEGHVLAETLRRLRQGVRIEAGRTASCRAALLKREVGRSVLEIELREGRRRQIRDMMRAVGHPVRRLVRVRFGPLRLGSLRPGESRRLTPAEARALSRLVEASGEPPPGSRTGRTTAKSAIRKT